MKNFKKLLLLLPVSLISAIGLVGCKSSSRVIRILNCEDYIYEYESGDEDYAYAEEDVDSEDWADYKDNYRKDMIDQFKDYWQRENGEEIEVVYDTFDTNETMFNELNTGKTSYDVIVPSDYMIQKLASKNMLEKISDESCWDNISPWLEEKFSNINIFDDNGNALKDAESDELLTIKDFSVPYMWGTVGIMYNPEFYSDTLDEDTVHELFTDWDSLYGEELKGSFSIKDSVRDTYAVSLIHTFRDEIKNVSNEENDKLTEIFNRHDVETMKKVKNDMLDLKKNAFGFECDSGKTDMTTRKIGANMCWSGDATWAITEAEDFGLEIYYSVPTSYEGDSTKGASNIWFDGFCMPKNAQKDLAQGFIKFMSEPRNAAQNCYCVGYTPGVAGDEMLEYILGEYEANATLEYYQDELAGLDEKYEELLAEAKNNKQKEALLKEKAKEEVSLKECIKDEEAWILENEGTEENYYDLRYFYGDTVDDAYFLPCVGSVGRQLTAQYPSKDMLPRLAVMNDFGKEGNVRLLDMWEQVRTNALPTWGIIVLAIEGVSALALAVYLIKHKVDRKRFKKIRHS